MGIPNNFSDRVPLSGDSVLARTNRSSFTGLKKLKKYPLVQRITENKIAILNVRNSNAASTSPFYVTCRCRRVKIIKNIRYNTIYPDRKKDSN